MSSDGFSLVELLAALLLTVITILGIAHTLALGNGAIDRYATGRAALARATGQVERVRVQVREGTMLGTVDSSSAVEVVPGVAGELHTHIAAVDDPADGAEDPSDPLAADYFRLRAVVTWTQGGVTDSVEVATLLLAP